MPSSISEKLVLSFTGKGGGGQTITLLTYEAGRMSGLARPLITEPFAVLEDFNKDIGIFTGIVRDLGNPNVDLPIGLPASRVFDEQPDSVSVVITIGNYRTTSLWTKVTDSITVQPRPPFDVTFSSWLYILKALTLFEETIRRQRTA